jgi:AcrR family transcriptional regulator
LPKIVNHEKYREELLDQAFGLFARRGYEITMRELARELGISTGTLYHYFKSKEEIFKQMMGHISRKQVKILIERIGKNKSIDEKIKLILEYVIHNESYFQNILFLIIDYYRQNNSSDPENIIRDMSEFYRQHISEQLGISNTVVASTFLSFAIGLLMHRVLDPAENTWEDQITLLRTMIGLYQNVNLKVA